MGLLNALFRRRPPAQSLDLRDHSRQAAIRARYDAAQTSDDNRRHWQWADQYSADAAQIPGVRRTLRMRSRYEIANNSYAKGIVLTIANDTVGTGPRLQMHGPHAADVADRWAEWSEAIRLARKLRTRVMARIGDGEAVALLVTNPRNRHPVKLDWRLVEADQLADPWIPWLTPNKIDGIEFDDVHDPIEYHVLKYHPGGLYPMMTLEFDVIPARYVLHLFRMDRPSQARGVPEITPALELFAKLRRFTEATISAAEHVANVAFTLKTLAPSGDEPPPITPFSTLEVERGMMTALPYGSELQSPKPEQPASTYEMFKREILNEIARCLNVPFNVAACNSSSYNYASGRLDHQVYFKSLAVDRGEIELTDLEPTLREWFAEASRVYGWDFPLDAHSWRWDKQADIDPDTEAKARMQRLQYGSSLETELAEIGRDVEEEIASGAKALGVDTDEFRALLRQKIFGLSGGFVPEKVKIPEVGEESAQQGAA